MKSFKDYSKPTNQEERMQTASAESLAMQIASAYHGKSNNEMLRNILLQAEKSKRAGTLSNEEIDNFYQTFSPMLDSSQRKKLKGIIEKLKQI